MNKNICDVEDKVQEKHKKVLQSLDLVNSDIEKSEKKIHSINNTQIEIIKNIDNANKNISDIRTFIEQSDKRQNG